MSTDADGYVGIHWVQGTIPHDREKEVLEYLSMLFERKPIKHDYGRFRYNMCYEFEPFGVFLYCDDTKERNKQIHNGRITLVLPGSCLDQFTADGLHKLCKDLILKFWFLATRIDVFWDDYRRIIEPNQVIDDADKGNISGFRKWQGYGERSFRDGELVRHGDTACFGRRGSDGSGKYLRVYDKYLESDGEMDCVHWEVEFSQERGKKVMLNLAMAEDVERMSGMIGAVIGGVVDFVDREAKRREKNIPRLNQLEWWARIIDILGVCKLRNPTPEKSVEKSAIWVERSVSVTLGMLRLAAGEQKFWEWIENVIQDGEQNMKSRQEAVLEEYYKQHGVPVDACRGSNNALEIPF
ncbi:replication initiation factor domain-containing protein [Planctomycetota bacterium]|nr:replication initiation factor domain-containing protein [Planctomycetota bacterium]